MTFGLTYHTVVFASMCVLYVLNGMDEGRLLLLGEDMVDQDNKQCLILGMSFLQSASQSNSLAARYLTILQHLSGENAEAGNINASQRNDLRDAETAQAVGNFQSTVSPWNIEIPGLTLGASLDFANFDDWLWEADPFSDPTMSTLGLV